MLRLRNDIAIPDNEIDLRPIRARGPGGQHVNKVATAIHLRFDIAHSRSLPDDVRARLLAMRDRRISSEGVVNFKAQRARSQDKNRRDALRRLESLLKKGLNAPKTRKKTRPSKRSKEKRLADKSHRSKLKATRRNLDN